MAKKTSNNRVYICVSLMLMLLTIISVSIPLYFTPSNSIVLDLTFDDKHKKMTENTTYPLNKKQGICNETYLISMTEALWTLKGTFNQHGFSRSCNKYDFKQLGMPKKNKYHNCLKYNRKLSHHSDNTFPFCNGGKLVFKDGFFSDTFLLRFTHKTTLNTLLTLYCNKFHNNNNICDFHILSYNMDIKQQRIEFLNKHVDCNNNKPQYENTWVFKEDKHMGTGIHIFNNHQLIYRLLQSDPSQQIKNCTFNPIKNKTFFEDEGFNYNKLNKHGYVVTTKKLLIQQFIDNPFLLYGHLFHLRSYFLIASYTNPLIILHWPKPVFFVNPNKYNNKQLNKTKLLTNRHQTELRSNDLNYEWSWGITEFQQYLNKVYDGNYNYTIDNLNNDLKHIIKHVFSANSYYNEMHNISKQKAKITNDIQNEVIFDQYCMDIIVNDKFQLKLMEINTKCLFFDDETKIAKKKKSGIYDWDNENFKNETTEIVLEIFKKKYHNNTIQKIDSLRYYQTVVWDKNV